MGQQEQVSQASTLSTSVWVPAHLAWQAISPSLGKEQMMDKDFAGLWQLERKADEEEGIWVISGVSSGLGAWTLSRKTPGRVSHIQAR